MNNIARFYAEQLRRWEDESYAEAWGQDWIEDVGEAVHHYAEQCAAKHTVPTFKGLMLFLSALRMGIDNQSGRTTLQKPSEGV